MRDGIYALSDSIAVRMRRKGMKCTTVQVTIKDPDFKTINRQQKLDFPTYTARDIRKAAMEIVKKAWNMKTPIRMLSVTGTGLIKDDAIYEQMTFFEADNMQSKKAEKLEKTVDSLKNRFGDIVSLGGRGIK